MVESQHQVATRKLVDSDAEQRVLEELIESAKPPLRTSSQLHYLLFTPFRYPPLRHGSRFGTRVEPGIWYGSEALRTAFAEVAYYRLLFIDGSSADLGLIETELTAYTATVGTDRGIDLTVAPFADFRAELSSPSEYTASQALGGAMRSAGVEAFRYASARDRGGGSNIGLFTAAAFADVRPSRFESWHCAADRWSVEVTRRDYFDRATFAFLREEFLVNGSLPHPAL